MKMVTFVIDQETKMGASLKALKALVTSYTNLFPVMVESSEDEKTSSSYSDLTSQDVVKIREAAAGSENHPVEEKDQVEVITKLTAPPVSVNEVVVLNATPVSCTAGKKILDGYHVVEITPPSPPLTFHVVVRAPPPLASLALGFPQDS
jgi:hypothetical protein